MPSGTLETVKERTDIVELIGRNVQLRQAGRTFKGLCPFHNEKSPSFVVYPDNQSFHCFGCGKSGDAFSYVMQTEKSTFATRSSNWRSAPASNWSRASRRKTPSATASASGWSTSTSAPHRFSPTRSGTRRPAPPPARCSNGAA